MMAKFFVSLIFVIISAGCAPTSIITTDGRTLEVGESVAIDSIYCEKWKNYYQGVSNEKMCFQAAERLKDIDTHKALSHYKKACDSGTSDNNVDRACHGYNELLYEKFNKNEMSVDEVIKYRAYAHSICMNHDFDEKNSFRIQYSCDIASKLYVNAKPNDYSMAISASKRACDKDNSMYGYYNRCCNNLMSWEFVDIETKRNIAEKFCRKGDENACHDLRANYGISYDKARIARWKANAEVADQQKKQSIQDEMEEERQAKRDEQMRRERQEAENQQKLLSAMHGAMNNINQGMRTYNNAVQINRQVDEQIRRKQEESNRQYAESQRRQQEEADRRYREQLEQQRREQEREQQQLVEAQRQLIARQQREAEQQEQADRQASEKRARQQQEKLDCHNLTRSVTAKANHPKGAGHCDGEVNAWLTNNSGTQVTCVLKFEKHGRLAGAGHTFNIKPGGTYGGSMQGLWSCGSTDSDTFKYYCVAATDSTRCIPDF